MLAVACYEEGVVVGEEGDEMGETGVGRLGCVLGRVDGGDAGRGGREERVTDLPLCCQLCGWLAKLTGCGMVRGIAVYDCAVFQVVWALTF